MSADVGYPNLSPWKALVSFAAEILHSRIYNIAGDRIANVNVVIDTTLIKIMQSSKMKS